jgi:hypothetical protein
VANVSPQDIQEREDYFKFEVLTVVLMKIHVFWDIQHFKEAEAWMLREEYP